MASIGFTVGIIYNNAKLNKLSFKKLKIYLLLIILGAIFTIISTYQLGILNRLLVGTLCLSPLLSIGLTELIRLFKKLKKSEKD